MKTSTYIYIEDFCAHHNIEITLVHQLVEFEVLTLERANNQEIIAVKELPKLEKMVRLHQELEINPQGLQAISHLLEQVENLQRENIILRRKLNVFE